MVDGIYNSASPLLIMEGQRNDSELRYSPDQNVFYWYETNLTDPSSRYHIIDWGAGVGRFVPYFQSLKPKKITLIEPSQSVYQELDKRFSSLKEVEVVNELLGYQSVIRVATPSIKTIHFCNFVLSSLTKPKDGLLLLEHSVRSGETLYIVTNVFIPKALQKHLNMNQPFNYFHFDIYDLEIPTPPENLPDIFRIKLGLSDAVFTDYVHTLAEFKQEFLKRATIWKVQKATLMPPLGFRQINTEKNDYLGYKFIVMALAVKRL
jgi:hypothetical protein